MNELDKTKEQLEKALIKLSLAKEKINMLEREPIAIIGMACRLPGNVNTPEDYWQLLINNQSGIIDIPSTRWDIDSYYDADKDSPGKMYVRKGGFLQTPIDEFDAELFHISPREAQYMDPQQRLALEVAYEAIEQAGIKPADLMRTATGVYMGICFNDYGHLITESHQADAVDNYYSTGNHYSVLSGRISYYFGLQGPSISMDTACSSSLVTLDAAVKDLRLKRCNLALAGGVNLMLAPEPTISFCKSGMLSPEGQCNTFDASADGYVRGEGCGILVLKRLSDALADNDTILALIRGTAVNQDGPSSGLTVPNGLAQEQVIKAALANAKINPNDVSYVEAHGTGTSLGDPIELEAIKNSYTKERDQDKPLRVGSVKTNIGHTEAVAGVASVMKVVLALIHEKIPATLHFKTLNPCVDLSNTPLEIASKNTDWPRGEKRMAGISSFGFSGTNAHVIIEEGPVLSEKAFNQWKERAGKELPFHRQSYWVEAINPNLRNKKQFKKEDAGYVWNWSESTLELNDAQNNKKWLIIADEGAPEFLVNRIESMGGSCSYLSVGANAYSKEEMTKLLKDQDIEGVLYLVANQKDRDLTIENIMRAQTHTLSNLMHCCQAMITSGANSMPFVLITHNINSGNVEQGFLRAFMNTLSIEHQDFNIKHIDLETGADLNLIFPLLSTQAKQSQFLISQNKILIPGLDRMNVESDNPVKIDSNGTYLVTGGLGGMGQALVKWLLEKGAGQVVITGRHEANEEVKTQVQKLSPDARITYKSLDLTDESSVKTFLTELKNHAMPLKGIFHLAGIRGTFSSLSQMNDGDVAEHRNAKILGSYYLHCYGGTLDLFVMYSSLASTLPMPNVGSYAMANAFLDSLSRYRNQHNQRTLSISWGPWAEVGMGKDDYAENLKRGIVAFTPEEGIAALEVALGTKEPHVLLATIQWENYQKLWLSPPSWLQNLSNQTVEIPKTAELSELIDKASSDLRLDIIKKYIKEKFRLVLKLPDSFEMEDKVGFFDFGMDSLSATELRNLLQTGLGDRGVLSSTIAFDYPTVYDLSQLILELFEIPVKEESQVEEKVIEQTREKTLDELRKELDDE